jgi:DNA polymerase-3 subunit delta
MPEKTFRTVKITGKVPFLVEKELDKFRYVDGYSVLVFDAAKDDFISPLRHKNIFFPEKKVLLVRNASEAKNPKDIQHYISNPDRDKILVLAEGSSKIPKWFNDLKTDKVIEAPSYTQYNAHLWLTQDAKRRGRSLDKSLAQAIVLNVGNDLASLSNELDKICLYTQDKTLKAEDIQKVILPQNSIQVFDIVNFWASKEIPKALQYFVRHYSTIPDNETVKSNMVLISSFLSKIETLIRANSLKASGMDSNQMAQELGLNLWVFKNKISDQINARNISSLRKSYTSICNIDRLVKTGSINPEIALENFIIQY